MTSLGIPKTTQAHSSCAMVRAPECFIASSPLVPSLPIRSESHQARADRPNGAWTGIAHQRAVARDQGAVAEANQILLTTKIDGSVAVPRHNIDVIRFDQVAVRSLLYLDQRPTGALCCASYSVCQRTHFARIVRVYFLGKEDGRSLASPLFRAGFTIYSSLSRPKEL